MEPRGKLEEGTVQDLLARLSDDCASGTLRVHGEPGFAKIVLDRGYVRTARAVRARRAGEDRAKAAFVGRRRKEFVSALIEIANWTGVEYEFDAGSPVDHEPVVPMIDPHRVVHDRPAVRHGI